VCIANKPHRVDSELHEAVAHSAQVLCYMKRTENTERATCALAPLARGVYHSTTLLLIAVLKVHARAPLETACTDYIRQRNPLMSDALVPLSTQFLRTCFMMLLSLYAAATNQDTVISNILHARRRGIRAGVIATTTAAMTAADTSTSL
jgi:succinate dehydrogenase hydrophobic anchor subunit